MNEQQFNNRSHNLAYSVPQISHSARLSPDGHQSPYVNSPFYTGRQPDYDNAKRKYSRSLFPFSPSAFPHRFKLALCAAMLLAFYLLVPGLFWYMAQLREVSSGSLGEALKSNLTMSVESILKTNEQLDSSKEQESTKHRYVAQLERIRIRLS